MKKLKTQLNRILSLMLALILSITTVLSGFPATSKAAGATTIYFVDATDEGWIANDSAVIELVDNTQGHDKYDMTKSGDRTWRVTVPTTAYNLTFNRYDSTKNTLWNSWSAGGRDGKITYEAFSDTHGTWTGEVKDTDNDSVFKEGDVIYLDVSSFPEWENDDALFYVNGTDATKKENGGEDVVMIEADKNNYAPSPAIFPVDKNVYSCTISEDDMGIASIRFWRGDDSVLWNCSVSISAKDYAAGKNCIQVTGWNETGNLTHFVLDEADNDGDGLYNSLENVLGTNKDNADTDADGLTDYQEVIYEYDPLKQDTDENGIWDIDEDHDGDGLTNREEMEYDTEIDNGDSDYEGLTDGEEVKIYQTDPLEIDTDQDGMNDYDEVVLGLNPLLKDSDGNGVTDDKEMITQTMSAEADLRDGKPESVTGVSLTIHAAGNIMETTEVYDDYHEGGFTSDVAGLVGVPFEFETESDFDTATISFYYNPEKLGDTKEEDLRVMWYDEENDRFELLEDSVLDKEKHTVSYTTTHFCTFLLVDRTIWLDTWRNAISYGRKNNDGDTSYYDIGFVIDTSGSMDLNGRMGTTKDAVGNFVDSMLGEDEACIVGFAASARVYQDFTCDKQKLKKSISLVSPCGATNVDSGMNQSLDLFEKNAENNHEKIMILICDGDINCTETTINRAIADGIKVYTVLISSDSGQEELKNISEQTGGEFFYAASSKNIIDSLSKIQHQTIDETDTTDTDGDGLYDVYETMGMIASNGHYYFSNPTLVDTDGDGLTDKEEMGEIVMRKSVDGIERIEFQLCSNPWSADTDGDLDQDRIDPKPKKFQLNGYFATKMEELDDLAKSYLDDNNNKTTVKKSKLTRDKHVWLTYMYLRNKNTSYRSDKWMYIGGKTDDEFVKYVEDNNKKIAQYFTKTTYIFADKYGKRIDLYHMAATHTGLIYKSNFKDGGNDNREKVKYQLMPEDYLDGLAGWAGDLQQFMVEIYRNAKDTKYKTSCKLFKESFLQPRTAFPSDDMFADTDAFNLYNLEKKKSISKSFEIYYTTGYLKRYTSFTLNSPRVAILSTVNTFTALKFLGNTWPIFSQASTPQKAFKLSEEQSCAAADIFTDYLISERKKE